MIRSGHAAGESMDKLGFDSYCCRRMILGHPLDLTSDALTDMLLASNVASEVSSVLGHPVGAGEPINISEDLSLIHI